MISGTKINMTRVKESPIFGTSLANKRSFLPKKCTCLTWNCKKVALTKEGSGADKSISFYRNALFPLPCIYVLPVVKITSSRERLKSGLRAGFTIVLELSVGKLLMPTSPFLSKESLELRWCFINENTVSASWHLLPKTSGKMVRYSGAPGTSCARFERLPCNVSLNVHHRRDV